MANWRPVDVRLWNDRKFLACSDGARLLWLFLLTCPALPIPGVVLGGDAALAEMLGWTPERLRERFQELSRNGLQVRRETRIVWLPNALKYQPPANPNMVKGWGKKWDDVPEGHLKLELWEALRIACKSWSVLFAKMFAQPLAEGSSNGYTNRSGNGSTHEHEHQHENEHENDLGRAPAAPTPSSDPPGQPNQRRPKREPKASKCLLPRDWTPRPQERDRASRTGLDCDAEAEKFRDHHTARANTMADWDAAFRTWLSNALRFANGTRAGPHHAPPSQTVLNNLLTDIARREAAGET